MRKVVGAQHHRRAIWVTFLATVQVTQGKMYHEVTLQLVKVLVYYTKQTGEMWLSISELPSFFSPYSAHQCSACIHISLNFSNTSRRWELFKITVSIDFHRQPFLHLWLWYNFLPPTLLTHSVFWHLYLRAPKWNSGRKNDTIFQRIYILIFVEMYQISGVNTCPYCAMRDSLNCLGELYGNVC